MSLPTHHHELTEQERKRNQDFLEQCRAYAQLEKDRQDDFLRRKFAAEERAVAEDRDWVD